MKVEVHKLGLADTSRTIEFRDGLNIVYGPISTGKTSVLRLCRMILGAAVPSLPPEVQALAGTTAEVTLNSERYQIFRSMSRADTAIVEVAGAEVTERLPALKSDGTNPTYGQWLLRVLGLPRLEVPSAPTRPESDPTPVSINDYMLYCDLPKEEIRSDVFGHRHPFRDIKRRYVFEILYGQYDVETAQLQDELRGVRLEIRNAEQDVSAFERVVRGTALENRAALERDLQKAKDKLAGLRKERSTLADQAPKEPRIDQLRTSMRMLDQHLNTARVARQKEIADVERFEVLARQLETQINRLTRAIVAQNALLDIDFVVCPRCGSSVDTDRADLLHCYLCLQEPIARPTHDELIEEQDRLALQLQETRQLSVTRTARATELGSEMRALEEKRNRVGLELDEALKTFVSDSAARLEQLAAERAALKERVKRLEDYISLYERRATVAQVLEEARRREADLLAKLEVAKTRREDVEARIQRLEHHFTEILRRLMLPDFLGDVVEVVGQIDRRTYLPSVSGRVFETLQSEGLSVEVNVAHALAHQLTALEEGLLLPNVLLIDGISGAFGERGYDPERVSAIYRELLRVCDASGGRLQVIVADTRVPDFASKWVVLELTEAERLVPLVGESGGDESVAEAEAEAKPLDAGAPPEEDAHIGLAEDPEDPADATAPDPGSEP